jgi:hypothetical protein
VIIRNVYNYFLLSSYSYIPFVSFFPSFFLSFFLFSTLAYALLIFNNVSIFFHENVMLIYPN